MKTLSLPGPVPRAATQSTDYPSFSLRDLVQALCSGLTPSADGLEMMLDRIERMP
ncbi:hypothetical protein LZA78_12040 [Sinirhodobacter sp. WL0062]|uniref:Uncharacterized protein n=1 Tax=Rhodobacter flavimaris TaxID=2907145 RepID=A0ABS8YY68_9RHOB|nr:hypothetical protein [Sinirhodobacter sp. WL0062]MCE5974215.1 hypothetical protein [Sinirhodobacter sp. WL0062]